MRTIDRSILIRRVQSPTACNSLAACRDACYNFNQTSSAYRKQWPRFKPRQTSIIPAGGNNSNVDTALPSSRTCSTIIDFRNVPTLESRRATSSGRPRTDRHPSTWRNIDYLSPTMNNRVEFAYYVRDFRRKVRSTADLHRRRNRIQRELSSDRAKLEVVSDVRIRNILGGSCR